MLQLFVNKSTDNFFAVLKVFGVAEFFRRSAGEDVEIVIEDIGLSYRISVNVLDGDVIARITKHGISNLLPAILPVQKIAKSQRYDGKKERYIPDDFQGQIIHFDAGNRRFGEQLRHDSKYSIWRYISKSHGSGNAMIRVYPMIIHLWHAHLASPRCQTLLLDTILKLLSDTKVDRVEDFWLNNVKPYLNDSNLRQFRWKYWTGKLSALSIVSPSTIKGNETVSARKGIQIHLQQIFWLEIYFAFVGFSVVALPFEPGKEELLVGYPRFEKLDFIAYRFFEETYRASSEYQTLWLKGKEIGTKQMEILAFLSVYFAQINEISRSGLQFQLIFNRYKKMRMHYPFGESTFSSNNGLSTAFSHPDVIQSLIKITLTLPKHEQVLIGELYDAMTTNTFADWLDFFLSYQTRMASLPWDLIRRILSSAGDIFMNQNLNYADIWRNRGFQKIAKAIYFSTLRAEYLKSQRRETALKPRYDLKNDLIQSASDKDQFLIVLWDFVADYQDVTRRVYTGEYFPHVPAVALVDMTNLVSQFGSRLVAHALIATAYSIRGKKKTKDSTVDNKD